MSERATRLHCVAIGAAFFIVASVALMRGDDGLAFWGPLILSGVWIRP